MNQMSVESKINKLIEESLSDKTKKRLKAAGIGVLGGAAGAGLDLYFTGGRNISEYVKPVMAWGAGGALSGALQDASDDKDKEAKKLAQLAQSTQQVQAPIPVQSTQAPIIRK